MNLHLPGGAWPPVRPLAALLTALAVAGCLAPPAIPDAPAPPAGTRLGVSLHTGFGSWEPTLGVTADGTLFVNAVLGPAPIGAVPAVLRSRDGGKTWASIGPALPAGQANPPYSGDPFLTYDTVSGRLYSADLTSFSCMSVAVSADEGDTWLANPAGCSATAGLIDHPSLIAARPRLLPTLGVPTILHACFNAFTDARCARSLDGGLTFGPTRPLVLAPGVDGVGPTCPPAATGRLQAAPDGTLWLPVADPCSRRPMVAVSRDDGLTWTERSIPTDRLADTHMRNGHEAAVAVDASGRAFVLWVSGGVPYVASSGDLGATWTSARRAAPPEVTAVDLIGIAAGAPGHVAVAYLGSTIPGGYEGRPIAPPLLPVDEAQANPDDWRNATWNAYLGILDGDSPLASWTANDPADPLARGACGQVRCAVASGPMGMGDFIGLVLDAQGRPWASFVDACTLACATTPGSANDRNEGLIATVPWPLPAS